MLLTEHGSDKTAERIVEALLLHCDELEPLENRKTYTVAPDEHVPLRLCLISASEIPFVIRTLMGYSDPTC